MVQAGEQERRGRASAVFSAGCVLCLGAAIYATEILHGRGGRSDRTKGRISESAATSAASSWSALSRRLAHLGSSLAGDDLATGDDTELLGGFRGLATGPRAVITQGGVDLAISLVNGYCVTAPGPSPGESQVTSYARAVGLWDADMTHLLCLPASGDAGQLVVSALDRSDSDRGEFGFGRGISLSLRPSIETNALWPLEDGVQSLDILVKPEEPFRALALRTAILGQTFDMPLIISRPRVQGWPMDVQFTKRSMGSCTPDTSMGDRRVLCRATEEDKARQQVQLLLFCTACAPRDGVEDARFEVSETDRENTTVLTSRDSSFAQQPWFTWHARVPEERRAIEWIVTVERKIQDAGVTRLVEQTFRIALVSGDGFTPWQPLARGHVAASTLGVGLRYIAMAAALAMTCVILITAIGLPTPVLGMLPAFSSALTILQFLALIEGTKHIPTVLRRLGEQLHDFSPASPALNVTQAFALIFVVAAMHAWCVILYIVRNGQGSANRAPHHLALGNWELRAISLVALPLSASATTLIVTGCSVIAKVGALRRIGDTLAAVGGVVVLIALCALCQAVFMRLRRWFYDESVVAVSLPKSQHAIFVDRNCDQIRALPLKPLGPGKDDKKSGSWVASPAWYWAPTVGAIEELEHHGIPEIHKPIGSSRTVWSDGPWVNQKEKDRKTQQQPQAQESSSPRRKNTRTSSSINVADSKKTEGPVQSAHPVLATTKYAYRNRNKGVHCVAGIVGLPWIDVAVPADKLRSVRSIIADAELNVNVLQLDGQLTGGRLGCCFDWCDKEPWRWPTDLLLKILLGAYIVGKDHIPQVSYWTNLLHVSVMAGFACLAFAIPCCLKPYVHMVDNIGLASVSLAISLSLFVSWHGTFPPLVGIAIAALAAVPLAEAIVAAVLVTGFAFRWRQLSDAKLLKQVVPFWGKNSGVVTSETQGNSPKAKAGYMNCLAEDDASSVGSFQGIQSGERVRRHTVNAVVIPDRGAKASKARLHLPAELKPEAVQIKLRDRRGTVGVGRSTEDLSAKPDFPVPSRLLFRRPVAGNELEKAATSPFAALLSKDEGELVYAEDKFNDRGRSWEEVVANFFRKHPQICREAKEHILGEQELRFIPLLEITAGTR